MANLYHFASLLCLLGVVGGVLALPFQRVRSTAKRVLVGSVVGFVAFVVLFTRASAPPVQSEPKAVVAAKAEPLAPPSTRTDPQPQRATASEREETPAERKPGRVRVCLTDDDVPMVKIREIRLPASTTFRDAGALGGRQDDFRTWKVDGESRNATLILLAPVTITATNRCGETAASMLIAPPSDISQAKVADARLFSIDDVLDYPIPPKRPGIEIGKLIDDISVQAIVIGDITASESRLPATPLRAEAAAQCLDGARKLAAILKGAPGRQTSSVVFIGNTAAHEISYGCAFRPSQAPNIFVAWENQARPPRKTSDVIAVAGEFVTGATQAEMRQETDACIATALKESGELADREFRGVKIECHAFARDGGGGSVTVYRRFGAGPTRPALTAKETAALETGSAAVRQRDADDAASSLAFATWWQDPALSQEAKTFAIMVGRMTALAERCPTFKVKPARVAELAASSGVTAADIEPGGRYFPLLVKMIATMRESAAKESRAAACEAASRYQ